jgi:Fe-S-cluster-containing dehydrogenase component/anaerobic selenocysteine-containing dehydrogenase
MNQGNESIASSGTSQPAVAPPAKLYWRSIEELTQLQEASCHAETPFHCSGGGLEHGTHRSEVAPAAAWLDGVSRRRFLTLMGASLALAGLSGCYVRPAPEFDIVPYVKPPKDSTPSRPLFFATTMTSNGNAVGLLAESHEGRPTKIEGNPDHPASRGATDVFHQASVLTLYDPDRSKTVMSQGRGYTWDEARKVIRSAMEKQRANRGAGLRLLTETVVSPTLTEQIELLLKDLPGTKWHVYEPIHRDMAWRGAQMAFGEPVNPVYDFSKADVVLSLDADFLQCTPGNLRYAADFMERRRVSTTAKDAATAGMNRLYVAETAVSCTGAKADHRLPLRPSEIKGLALAIAGKLGLNVGRDDAGPLAKWVSAVVADLDANRGRCVVLAGDRQPPQVHVLAHAINDHLGNVGQTVTYTAPIDAKPGDRTESLRELVRDMERGRVELLVILGGNPVYNAPADFNFAEKLKRVKLSIRHGLYEDETSKQCNWHLPEAHYLEAWSDARAYDGTASIVQPLIQPLYEGRSAHDVIALLAGQTETAGHEIVRAHWRRHWEDRHEQGGFEPFWRKVLHDGLVADTAAKPKTVKLTDRWRRSLGNAPRLQSSGVSAGGGSPQYLASSPADADAGRESLEILFLPDPMIFDGSWANNGWLQEMPKPLTKLAWGNPAIISPVTAKRLGVELGSYAHGGEHGGYYMPVVELQLGDAKLRAPAWIMPGHADDTVTVYLGHGRKCAGGIGGTAEETIGFNAYLLRTADRPWFASGLDAFVTREKELVCCTQEHHSMGDPTARRDPVRSATLAEYHKDPHFVANWEFEHEHAEVKIPRKEITLYDSYPYGPPQHRWGMLIDLTACIGCHACVAACQAENNIPVVGKDQVSRGREMHWLRVDRYVQGTAENPGAFHFQPVPCMHCENAPCEYVCPVEATVHSADGLNEMVYNRCVGTRFCSNNCPYKVRRFNFLAFSDFKTETRRLQYNPEVTVRSRGVMEKCTYCVQRIRRGEIDAETADRPLVDGDVMTACQAVCPTGAIFFGDMNDPKSKVRRAKDSPLHYALLGDINTQPRTTYLAELRNPNPELES